MTKKRKYYSLFSQQPITLVINKFITLVIILTISLTTNAQNSLCDKQPLEDWWAYARDGSFNRFTPLDQITAENFNDLKVAWEWNLPVNDIELATVSQTHTNQSTPIKVGKYLYSPTGVSQVAKLDLDTGKPVMSKDDPTKPLIYEPELYKKSPPHYAGFITRGLSYWRGDDGVEKIFLGRVDAKLVALDPETLQPVVDFGNQGIVDVRCATKGESEAGCSEVNEDPYRHGLTSPPAICNDHVIVGSSINDFDPTADAPKGKVKAFKATDGTHSWTFNTIPSDQEMKQLGLDEEEQWTNDSWKTYGQANVWTMISVDESLGLAYLPVSSSSNDAYGGGRHGDNLFSQSVVAVSCETGEYQWHFQMIRHGVWDYDPPYPPILMDIEEDGQTKKLLAQVTKQGFVYVLDRETGEPRFKMNEVEVPESDVPGEKLAATQKIPALPLPFDHQGVFLEGDSKNIISLNSPALEKRARQIIDQYHYGPLYTPPTVLGASGKKGTLQVPGFLGGASWAGAVANPNTGHLFVSSVTSQNVNAVCNPNDSKCPLIFDRDNHNSPHSYFTAGPFTMSVTDENGNKWPYPLFKPPFGRVTGIDLVSGNNTWSNSIAIGKGPREELEVLIQNLGDTPNIDEGDLGWNRRSHLLVSPNLLFVAQEAKRKFDKSLFINWPFPHIFPYRLENYNPSLKAYDQKTAEFKGEIKLPYNAQGALMSFGHKGKQYIVIPTGGFDQPSKLVALALPD